MYDNDTIDLLAKAGAYAENPVELMGPDAWNYLMAWHRDIERQTPAKVWWNLPFDHAAIARALRIDRTQPGASYALRPFRYAKIKGRHLILAAHPCPREFAPINMDWLGIETVIAWEPSTGAVNVLTDDRPQLFGKVTESGATLFADPRAFFTAWMRERAQYVMARQQASMSAWAVKPREVDTLPGALIVGAPDAVQWPIHDMPRHFQCVGIEPKAVNRAILKSARLPMCTGNDMARAA